MPLLLFNQKLNFLFPNDIKPAVNRSISLWEDKALDNVDIQVLHLDYNMTDSSTGSNVNLTSVGQGGALMTFFYA